MITANPFLQPLFAGQPSRGRVVGSTPGLDTSSCFICSHSLMVEHCLGMTGIVVRFYVGAPVSYALLAQFGSRQLSQKEFSGGSNPPEGTKYLDSNSNDSCIVGLYILLFLLVATARPIQYLSSVGLIILCGIPT